MHFYAFIDQNNASFGYRLLDHMINVIGNTGVTIFVLISGYYGVKYKIDKLIYLILLTIVYPLLLGWLINGPGISIVISSLQSVFSYKNWFVSCYLILMILSPYVNSWCDDLSDKYIKRFVVTGMFLFSILPTFCNGAWSAIINGGGKNFTYFLFVYIVGRWLRRIRLDWVNNWKLMNTMLISLLCALVFNFMIDIVLEQPVKLFALDCSPFMLISASCIFLIASKKTSNNLLINYFAKSVFPIYLLHSLIGSYLHKFVFNSINFQGFLQSTALYFLIVVITVFVCVIIDQFRLIVLNKYLDSWSKKIGSSLEYGIEKLMHSLGHR